MHGVRRPRDERGALSIEFLAIIGALTIVFLVMLQDAVTAPAPGGAAAAAEAALAAAAAYDGSADSGQTAAHHYLDDIEADLLDPKVTVTRNASAAAVTVKGDVRPFIPFLSVHVSVHLEGPIEKFVESP